jgi:hypothetical protein
MANFFGIENPGDYLAKLEREYARFKSEPECDHPDHIFNFMVTAHALLEYVVKLAPQHSNAVGQLAGTGPMQLCRDIGNRSKHVTLTRNNRLNPESYEESGAIGGAPINAVPINGGSRWKVGYPGRDWFDAEEVVDQVMFGWRSFFQQNNIT